MLPMAVGIALIVFRRRLAADILRMEERTFRARYLGNPAVYQWVIVLFGAVALGFGLIDLLGPIGMLPSVSHTAGATVMLTPRQMGGIWVAAGVAFIAFRRRIARATTSDFEAPDLTSVTRTLVGVGSFLIIAGLLLLFGWTGSSSTHVR